MTRPLSVAHLTALDLVEVAGVVVLFILLVFH